MDDETIQKLINQLITNVKSGIHIYFTQDVKKDDILHVFDFVGGKFVFKFNYTFSECYVNGDLLAFLLSANEYNIMIYISRLSTSWGIASRSVSYGIFVDPVNRKDFILDDNKYKIVKSGMMTKATRC